MALDYETTISSVKPLLQQGRAALGLSVRGMRSPEVARIARATGHDFLFIDTQHALFNLEAIGQIAHTALAIGVAPMVRCRSVDDPDVPALLDGGITGIVFPDVGSVAQAELAVSRCKYPPVGKRSLAGNGLMSDFRASPFDEQMRKMNELTVVACMIETLEGLENVEAIAAVPGVDVVHLGTNDLLVAMGKPGQFDHPDIIAAQERVIAAAKANGKFAGCGGNRDVARQAGAIAKGAQFITTQTDIAFLFAAANRWATDLRQAINQ